MYRFFYMLFLSVLVGESLACTVTSIDELDDGINKNIDPSCIVDTTSLMANRRGFAKGVSGGLNGDVFLVTSLSDEDDDEFSLRKALERLDDNDNVPRWILFKVSGTIALKNVLSVPNDITIDGRGTYIRLINYGLKIYDADNVIVENIIIENGVETSTDAIEIVRSNNIWIDHSTLSNFPDGLIDIKGGCLVQDEEDRCLLLRSRITVSWCRFQNHNKTMMIGLHKNVAPYDKYIYVTLHHNFFDGTNQRHPRLSQGYAHLYNNVITWGLHGSASFDKGKLYLERNYFESLNPTNLVGVKFHHGGFSGDYLIPDGYVYAPLSGDDANRLINNDQIELRENYPESVQKPGYFDFDSADSTTDCNYFKVIWNSGFQTNFSHFQTCPTCECVP